MKHDDQILIISCDMQGCEGHKGPEGWHNHFFVYWAGNDAVASISRAFASRKAGQRLAACVFGDEVQDDRFRKIGSELRRKLRSVDLVDNYGDEHRFITEWSRIARSAEGNARALLSQLMFTFETVRVLVDQCPTQVLNKGVQHGKYCIQFTGCTKHQVGELEFLIGGHFKGSARVTGGMDNVRSVFVQALIALKIGSDHPDAQALRTKLEELFAQ